MLTRSLALLIMYAIALVQRSVAFKAAPPHLSSFVCRRRLTSLNSSTNATPLEAAAAGRKMRAGSPLANNCCYSPKDITENKGLVISHMVARCGGDSSKARHFIEW